MCENRYDRDGNCWRGIVVGTLSAAVFWVFLIFLLFSAN
jgi:hypothetical protein